MTRQEMFDALVDYAGFDYDSSQDDFLYLLIDAAIEEVVRMMYPYGASTDETALEQQTVALARHPYTILRVAEYHYDKQGKEGVKSFTENSTSSSYEVAGTPPSMLRHIIAVAQIV